MRRRFFVEKFEGRRAEMRGEAAEHLGRVLRAEPGQVYELSDGEQVWLGRVEKISRSTGKGAAIEFALTEKIAAEESLLRIQLLLSIVKFDRMEWCLEKATELGVTEIVPLAAARSDKALILAAKKRAERWRKILVESAQQSRRLRPPLLAEIAKTENGFAAADASLKIMLSERADAKPLREILRDASAKKVCIAIGPEGGWTDAEFAAAAKNQFREASLGREILRTETAVIATLATLKYALDRDRNEGHQ
ncbi:MAG TPA: RsmE family RNA methyltransferase [Candidatus Acidoferrales bacterium]|nr:RsmE family RNA methyltransferase [Candidatus Acidoferrales bacterium]